MERDRFVEKLEVSFKRTRKLLSETVPHLDATQRSLAVTAEYFAGENKKQIEQKRAELLDLIKAIRVEIGTNT